LRRFSDARTHFFADLMLGKKSSPLSIRRGTVATRLLHFRRVARSPSGGLQPRMRKAASRLMLFVRLIASPHLSPNARDALHRRFAADGKLLACVNDEDVSSTFLSLGVAQDDLRATISAMAETIGAAQAVGRAFRLELQHVEAAAAISDEAVRAVAVDLHGALRASVHVARRSMPAGRWTTARPMGWGSEGLALMETAPALPFGGSESSGLAIEVGSPTVIAKARLVGSFDAARLSIIAAATGTADSGLTEVGAYPISVHRDGSATLILELGDSKRTPLHRVLQVLDIEARVVGGSVGLGTLLSDAPLDVFLDALSMHMGLRVARAQVIETHLAGGAAPR
jgi:hypothetical protein